MTQILDEVVGTNYRWQLRANILESRGRFLQPGLCEVICGTCWEWMSPEAAPMHEALITRGHVHKSPPAYRHLIFHPCNVVFRHERCNPTVVEGYDQPVTFRHEGGVGGSLIFERCAISLIAHEGHDRVREYLVALQPFLPYVAGEALLRFDAVVRSQ